MVDRRPLVLALSVALAIALGCVALLANRGPPTTAVLISQESHKLSFAEWYQQQSAAAWFGGVLQEVVNIRKLFPNQCFG